MKKVTTFSKNKTIDNKTYPGYFLIGAVTLYVMLYVLPGIAGVILSFTDWHVARDISELKFIGLDNFAKIFSPEEEYFKYLKNTFIFAGITSIFKTIFALLIALLLVSKIRLRNFHRAAMFFPSIISILVTGLIFRSILHPGKGIINVFISFIGLESLTQDWLNNVTFAFPSVMAVDIWRGIGYIMVIYLAGLQSIPVEYYEASSIDGANSLQKFWHVTLPLLKPTIIVTSVLNLIYGLRVFDIVYVLTKGGPGDATDVMYTAVFREFSTGNFALGSALSSVMFIMLALFGYFSVKLITKREVAY